MSSTHSEAKSLTDDSSIEDLDKRDARALSEAMVVLPDEEKARGADGLFVVIGENSNGSYLVDTVTGACECPDHQYNLPTDDGRETCKHVARAEYATGQRAIPQWMNPDAVDSNLGCATDDGPRYAATDGGEILTDDDDTDDTDPYRPDDCSCLGSFEDLCCFACWQSGFRLPPADADD
jgi:predicted nucleic acid-binding Zn finger protein